MASLLYGLFRKEPVIVEESFVDKHFSELALTISAIVLLIFATSNLILGAAIGFIVHHFSEPDLKLAPNEKVTPLSHSVVAIVGAVAAILRFRAIPLFASCAVGSTLYRATRVF